MKSVEMWKKSTMVCYTPVSLSKVISLYFEYSFSFLIDTVHLFIRIFDNTIDL